MMLMKLSVPGAPKLTIVLPYYDSKSNELKKIDVQIMTESSVKYRSTCARYRFPQGTLWVELFTFNCYYSNPGCAFHI